MRALDEAEAAALAVTVGAELTRFSDASRSVAVPVLRADEIVDEFRIYESRAAGADAVLLRASAVPRELLARLARAAASTHMAPCVVCASAEEMVHAASLRAVIAVESAELLSAAPARTLILALRDLPGLAGRADAVLDAELTDPARFRESLEEH
jgi:indole-3-glycerol phosphate synthase